jgi:hypothetical protein
MLFTAVSINVVASSMVAGSECEFEMSERESCRDKE